MQLSKLLDLKRWPGAISSRVGLTGSYSYSQCGEDLIVQYALRAIGKPLPAYLDIGANDPRRLSNSYYFYRRGARGVCVEPDPVLCARYKQVRPRDTALNVGVGLDSRTSCEFFVMSTPTLNTFSRESAETSAKIGGYTIENVISVPLMTVNEIIARHLPAGPDFVSIDVEGLDLDIVRSFDFSRWKPSAFCVETLEFEADKTEHKVSEVGDHLAQHGYMLFADTYLNSIYVDRDAWLSRKSTL